MQAGLTLVKSGGYCRRLDKFKGVVSRFQPSTASLKILLTLAVLCGFIGAPSLALGGTIITDEPAYPIGDTVIIAGSGYAFNETITLQVNTLDGSGGSGQTPWTVTASSTGEFTAIWIVPTGYFNDSMVVTATGNQSGISGKANAYFVAAPAQADLDQARNGTASSPTSPVDFVNGNAGSSNSHYREGHSIPYRMIFSNVTLDTHVVIIEWDIKHSSKNAIDYITYYNRLLPHAYTPAHSPEIIDPLEGLSGTFSAPSTFAIPAPSSAGSPVVGQPTASFNSLPAGERVMTIYNGTINNLTYLSQGSLTAASSATQLRIKFTATNSKVVLAWGGHIASALDWGAGNSAGGISGSPYHTRLIEFDGSGGNQDRSLSAQAVALPPTCVLTGLTSVCAGTTSTYSVSTDACSPTYSWSFTSNTSGAAFIGSTTGSSVSVSSGSGGQYILRVTINSCDGFGIFCEDTVTVSPLPPCSINGPDSVCPGTTNTHCGPAGLPSYSWSVSGGGTIIGSSTSQCVNLQASSGCNTSYTLTLNVTGACGSNCSKTVLVKDVTKPVVSCPANITTNNTPGQCGAAVSFSASATDNCPGAAAVVCTPSSGSFFAVGTTSVKCVATDACNNKDSCTFTVTVNDTQKPTVACPANINTSNDPGQCAAFVSYTATPSDNCPGASLVCTPPSGSSFAVGTTSVKCVVTDAAGNKDSCSFTVTVNDTEDPSVVCPANISTSNDPGQCSAAVTYSASTSDNCPGPVSLVCTPPSGSAFPVGTTTVNCTATDAAGNQASCSFTVTVSDNEAPVVTCPADIITGNDPGQCSAVVTYSTTSSDNCPGAVTVVCTPPSGSTFPVGTTTVNCTATDAAGNSATCSFLVTVNDNQNPSITCPANIVKNNDPGQCGALASYTATATDNCPGVSYICTPPSGSFFPIGTTTVTCTATDASGNQASCSFMVTVNDTENPAISCPANITTSNDPGQCGAAVSYAAPATDNCPGVIVVCNPPSGSFFPIGTTPVNCTATDASGNQASCSFTVTVNDTEDPTISCPPNIVKGNDPNNCDTMVTFTAIPADNCPGVSYVCNPPSGSSFPVGTTVVTCTATDAAGNQASCQFTVTVNDVTGPTIVCSPNITTGTDPGRCDAAVSYTVTASNGCPGVTLVCNPPSGSIFPKGITTVNCTATDVAGNTASCSFTVAVNDDENPTVTCPANITTNTTPGQCGAAVSYTAPATDNCPGVIVNCTPPSGSFFPVGTTTVSCTATDASGNTESCQFTVTVNDNENPTVSCPANITTNTAPGRCDADVSYTVSGADNCAGEGFFVNCTPPPGSSFPKGVTTVTCTATDASGNSASCQFTVTVNDNENPTVSCPANITTGTAPGRCDASVSYTVTPGDNCPGVTLVCTPPSGSVFPKGVTPVNCTATDAAGNTASCSFTVTVNDNENPTVNCPANITTTAAAGRCDATVSYTAAPNDNCPGVTLVCTPPSGSTFSAGTTTVKCVATDAAGNKDSCQFTITVNDVQKPLVNCPANINVNNSPGRCDATVSYTASASDNCGPVTPVCTPPSGSSFAVGTTTVKCVATDAAGNKDSCQFTVTVQDNEPPSVQCPPGLTIQRTPGVCFTPGIFQVPASDNCPGTVTVVCVPPSGSTFPSGTTTVNCTATDANGNSANCSFNVTVLEPGSPGIACADTVTSAAVGETVQIHIQVSSANPAFIVQLLPGSTTHNGLPATPTNPPSIQNNRDLVWAVNGDTGRWCFQVKVTDGCGDFDTCSVCIDVFLETCLQLQIAKIENAFQGQDWEVSIDNPEQFADPGVQPNPSGIGGFSFLLSYDCSCLQFLSARKGQMLVDQGWEFFTYRFGAIGNGNCGTGCPSCLIRIVAIADVNNGSAHPNMSRNNMGQWVVLKFRVTNDRTFAGQFCQVNWFWFDCTDNTVSDSTGNQLWVVDALTTFEGTPIDLATEFPSNVANCDQSSGGPGKPSPRKKLCFRNGGIDIPTPEQIDDRGDLNLNGLGYEVADAVLYENYFIYGPSVLSPDPTRRQSQLAASDINGDGLILSVGDLVALIRVLTGDAQPLPKLNPNAASVQLSWREEGNELKIITSSASELGGLFLNFKYAGRSVGEIKTLTAAEGMNFRAYVEGGTLRVLVHSETRNGMIPAGAAAFALPVDGTVEFVEAQVSNYQGQNLPVMTRAAALPTAFDISQNYPNPFNGKTSLALALPVASDYSLTIYNISGQVIKTFSGSAPAGTKIITWDGTDKNGVPVSSGIYFYKTEAGSFHAVKKMLLIK